MNEKQQEILKLLEADLKTVGEALEETVGDIVKHGFSQYPVLLAHVDELSIADKVIDRNEYQTNFNFSASTLEVLISKGIILQDKKQALIDQFVSKNDQACIFMVHPDMMNIIFSPLTKK
ncbi:hypothetical protein GYB22_01165 [bacterium]|nr:hypothetical protein [bacterium]